mmetsp:Transcript_40637/g.46846  ORF Transcript_40637/g.46846 Transcript_40637/m.46846 type:complete len:88 (+) Transcript_40637:105-368(+)
MKIHTIYIVLTVFTTWNRIESNRIVRLRSLCTIRSSLSLFFILTIAISVNPLFDVEGNPIFDYLFVLFGMIPIEFVVLVAIDRFLPI